MTSKNSLHNTCKLIFDTMGKKLWFLALSILGFFFLLPVNLMLQLPRLIEHVNENADFLSTEVPETILQLNIISTVLLIGFGVVAGLVYFSYLHSKKQIDHFHSMPIKREKLFFINFSAGALAVLIPFLVNALITLIIFAGAGLLGYINFSYWLSYLAGEIGFFLLIYGITVLAGVLTGSTIMQVLVTAFFNALVPVCVGIYILTMSFFYSTFMVVGDSLSNIAINGSPIAAFVNGVFAGQLGIAKILIAIGLAVLVYALATFVYKKRPSEGAGRPLVFSITVPFIKYILVFLATVLAGIGFASISYNHHTLWFIFGVLAGGILTAKVLDVILEKDFKAIFRHNKVLAIYFVAFAIVISVPIFDFSHYDTYLPEAEKVEKVEVYFSNIDGSYQSTATDIYRQGLTYYNHTEAEMSINPLSTPENINLVLAIAEKSFTSLPPNPLTGKTKYVVELEGDQNHIEDPEPTSTVGEIHHIKNTGMNVKYTLTSGKVVYRAYPWQEVENIKTELAEIITSEEYVKNLILPYDDKFSPKVVEIIASINDDFYVGFNGGAPANDFQIALLKAYQKDLKENYNVETISKTMPVASLNIQLSNTVKKTDKFLAENSVEIKPMGADVVKPNEIKDDENYRTYTMTCEYPIYPTFTNTLSLLNKEYPKEFTKNPNVKATGIDIIVNGEEYQKGEDISYFGKDFEYFGLGKYWDKAVEASASDDNVVRIRNAEEISYLLENVLVKDSYRRYNNFGTFFDNSNFEFKVTFENTNPKTGEAITFTTFYTPYKNLF